MLDPFFRKLEVRDALGDDERLALIAAGSPQEIFAPGADLVREGDRPERSILVISGFCTRYRLLADGQRQIMAIHIPGDFVDLHSFLIKQMDHSVGALSECVIVPFPHANLAEITRQFPHLTRLLWLTTLLDSAILREWIVAMGRRSAVNQLAHLICELYVRLDLIGAVSDQTFVFPVTQTDLGDTLGLSPVHVNRIIQELRRDGLIAWRDRVVRILDWPALQARAEFDPTYLHLTREPR